jgi:hypothetical protein
MEIRRGKGKKRSGAKARGPRYWVVAAGAAGAIVAWDYEGWSPTLGGRLSFKVINNDFLLADED